jgi:hypothetical protein
MCGHYSIGKHINTAVALAALLLVAGGGFVFVEGVLQQHLPPASCTGFLVVAKKQSEFQRFDRADVSVGLLVLC